MKEFIKRFIPSFFLNYYHCLLAAIGAFLYRFPAKKLIVIGVTGTSGKSTVVEMINRILEKEGHKTAMLSSIKFKIGEEEKENMLKMTMPGRMKTQRFLRQAKNAGCEYVVLEVTSEGIKQYRHKFINFDVAILTNLSPEHIESHGGFEKYRRAKEQLFQETKEIHIINLDDKNADYFLSFPASQRYCYGLNTKLEAEKLNIENCEFVNATNIDISKDGIEFIVNDTKFHLNLLGKFNVYNALAAISLGLSQGISLKTSKEALLEIKTIPGRMEIVADKPITVVIDYAHTPDALEKVYQTLVNYKEKKNKMVCVLGSCGGGRDKWKRPVLGEIAAKYCDKVIITNEDPYNEDPIEIIEQVARGAQGRAIKILNRKKAIKDALELSKEGDIVIVTGKGSEPWMCVKGGKKIPWDDRQIARDWLNKYNFRNKSNI